MNPNTRDLESSALLSPSIRSSRDSISIASEPPEFSAEEAEDLLKRGSISTQTIRRMFTGERSSRSPSRSRTPGRPLASDALSPSRGQEYPTADVNNDHDDNFKIGGDGDHDGL
jgi:hypothetical protein